MKRIPFILFIFGSLFLMAMPRFAVGEEIKGRWAIGGRYRYIDTDDADFKGRSNESNINLTYGLTDYLAAELEGGYFSLKSKASTRLDVYSLHSSLQLRANLNRLYPYFVAGVGMQLYDYSKLGEGDREDNDVSYSYKFGPGVEYFFDHNWAANLEIVYAYGNTGGDATLDVYGWQYGVGIKYYF